MASWREFRPDWWVLEEPDLFGGRELLAEIGRDKEGRFPVFIGNHWINTFASLADAKKVAQKEAAQLRGRAKWPFGSPA